MEQQMNEQVDLRQIKEVERRMQNAPNVPDIIAQQIRDYLGQNLEKTDCKFQLLRVMAGQQPLNQPQGEAPQGGAPQGEAPQGEAPQGEAKQDPPPVKHIWGVISLFEDEQWAKDLNDQRWRVMKGFLKKYGIYYHEGDGNDGRPKLKTHKFAKGVSMTCSTTVTSDIDISFQNTEQKAVEYLVVLKKIAGYSDVNEDVSEPSNTEDDKNVTRRHRDSILQFWANAYDMEVFHNGNNVSMDSGSISKITKVDRDNAFSRWDAYKARLLFPKKDPPKRREGNLSDIHASSQVKKTDGYFTNAAFFFHNRPNFYDMKMIEDNSENPRDYVRNDPGDYELVDSSPGVYADILNNLENNTRLQEPNEPTDNQPVNTRTNKDIITDFTEALYLVVAENIGFAIEYVDERAPKFYDHGLCPTPEQRFKKLKKYAGRVIDASTTSGTQGPGALFGAELLEPFEELMKSKTLQEFQEARNSQDKQLVQGPEQLVQGPEQPMDMEQLLKHWISIANQLISDIDNTLVLQDGIYVKNAGVPTWAEVVRQGGSGNMVGAFAGLLVVIASAFTGALYSG